MVRFRKYVVPFMTTMTSRLLLLPPSARWTLNQGDALRQDCIKFYGGGGDDDQNKNFYWEPDIVNCDYRLATKIFRLLVDTHSSNNDNNDNNPLEIWLPKLDERKLIQLVEVLNQNSKRLGGIRVASSGWPKTPATRLMIEWNDQTVDTITAIDDDDNDDSNETIIQSSIQATEKWVEQTLCGLNLCPYTYSMERAAVGLESVGVKEGPIEIRHSERDRRKRRRGNSLPVAPSLAHAFWQGVEELASKSEDQLSTLLIVAPDFYDTHFVEFAATFDNLIEPSVQVTGSEAIVGRALFHPTYESDLIGHDKVLPGHALPASMVEGFLDRYLAEEEGGSDNDTAKKKPDLKSIALANDAVRWTPHATINLLRRTQVCTVYYL